MHHVVIGAGPAGVIASETLRKLDPNGSVTLIGDEPEPPYARMAIPYFLTDKVGEAGTYLRENPGHYERQGIAIRQTQVLGIDIPSRPLALSNSDDLTYDWLLVATGSSPTVPPVPGIDSPGVLPCWTLADAREIVMRAQPSVRVVLMGAGFIGCIILEALVQRRAELTVVEPQNRMVPRMMNETAGGLIKGWCQTRGVRVLTSTRITGIESGPPLQLDLDDGHYLTADLVIRATGVRPNIAFLAGSGVDTEHGVLVDTYQQTSAEGVYAAGDVCQASSGTPGDRQRDIRANGAT